MSETRQSIPDGTHALMLARIDRAKIRAAFGTVWGEPTGVTIGGIDLRVNPMMPEGICAAVDRDGRLLALIDMRGDHDA